MTAGPTDGQRVGPGCWSRPALPILGSPRGCGCPHVGNSCPCPCVSLKTRWAWGATWTLGGGSWEGQDVSDGCLLSRGAAGSGSWWRRVAAPALRGRGHFSRLVSVWEGRRHHPHRTGADGCGHPCLPLTWSRVEGGGGRGPGPCLATPEPRTPGPSSSPFLSDSPRCGHPHTYSPGSCPQERPCFPSLSPQIPFIFLWGSVQMPPLLGSLSWFLLHEASLSFLACPRQAQIVPPLSLRAAWGPGAGSLPSLFPLMSMAPWAALGMGGGARELREPWGARENPSLLHSADKVMRSGAPWWAGDTRPWWAEAYGGEVGPGGRLMEDAPRLRESPPCQLPDAMSLWVPVSPRHALPPHQDSLSSGLGELRPHPAVTLQQHQAVHML